SPCRLSRAMATKRPCFASPRSSKPRVRGSRGSRRSPPEVEAPRWNPDLAGTYDRVAAPYGEQFFDELARKPFDRELLDRFAARLSGRGLVCDVGCGPGHVGRYLAERGVDVFGLDLSTDMAAAMEQAGFRVESITTRAPYDFEYQSTRAYAAGVKR